MVVVNVDRPVPQPLDLQALGGRDVDRDPPVSGGRPYSKRSRSTRWAMRVGMYSWAGWLGSAAAADMSTKSLTKPGSPRWTAPKASCCSGSSPRPTNAQASRSRATWPFEEWGRFLPEHSTARQPSGPAAAPQQRRRHRRRELPHEGSPNTIRRTPHEALNHQATDFCWPPAGTSTWPLTPAIDDTSSISLLLPMPSSPSITRTVPLPATDGRDAHQRPAQRFFHAGDGGVHPGLS
jgi:hypothetical protein